MDHCEIKQNEAPNPVTLFQENIKLTSYFIRLYYPKVPIGTFLFDELIAEARVSLWKAAKSYDPEKGQFTTYVGALIRGDTLKYYTRVHRKQSKAFDVYLDTPNIEYNSVSMGDLIPSGIDVETEVIKKIVKQTVIENYPTLKLYYLEGLTQIEIAKRVGTSQISISRNIKAELMKIGRELKLA